MILPGLHSCTNTRTTRFTHMLWCCHGSMRRSSDGVCVVCVSRFAEGSPATEAICSSGSLSMNTSTRCGLQPIGRDRWNGNSSGDGCKKDLRWHLNTNRNPRPQQWTLLRRRGGRVTLQSSVGDGERPREAIKCLIKTRKETRACYAGPPSSCVASLLSPDMHCESLGGSHHRSGKWMMHSFLI